MPSPQVASLHASVHRSPACWLPSSHSSAPPTLPSPHTTGSPGVVVVVVGSPLVGVGSPVSGAPLVAPVVDSAAPPVVSVARIGAPSRLQASATSSGAALRHVRPHVIGQGWK